jgi:hypothetical protein
MRTFLAFAAAVLLPTFIVTAWYLYGQFAMFEPGDPYIWVRTGRMLTICLSTATAYVVILGAPAFLLLRKLQGIRWWSTIGTGFVLGSLPIAIITWPLRYPELRTSASVDGVSTMIDGTPTVAGWVQYASGFSTVGLLGAAGALAFWVVSRR